MGISLVSEINDRRENVVSHDSSVHVTNVGANLASDDSSVALCGVLLHQVLPTLFRHEHEVYILQHLSPNLRDLRI